MSRFIVGNFRVAVDFEYYIRNVSDDAGCVIDAC